MKRIPLLLTLILGFTTPALAQAEHYTHTVRPGDTISRVAEQYGTDAGTLARLNGLRYSNLDVGQVLKLPAPGLNSSRQTPVIPRSYSDVLLPAPKPGKLQRGLFTPTFGLSLNRASSSQPQNWVTRHFWQTRNNCGPASISALLSFYGLDIPQNKYQSRLRPKGGYMTVEAGVKLLRDLGFQPVHKKGATLSDLNAALAKGPVQVLQWHSEIGRVPHFRIVTGYDLLKSCN